MVTPSVTDWITAVSSVVYTLLTAGLLLAAVKAWRTASDALRASQTASNAAAEAANAARQSNAQAALDSVQRTRPYVFVELLPGLQGTGCYDLRIANAGQSAARKLSLDCESWPSIEDNITASIKSLFARHRTLPPGCSIRAVWRIEDTNLEKQSSGMPPDVAINVRYTSDDPSGPQYDDVFEVSVSTSGLWPVPEDGSDPELLSGPAQHFYLLGQALVRRVGELSR